MTTFDGDIIDIPRQVPQMPKTVAPLMLVLLIAVSAFPLLAQEDPAQQGARTSTRYTVDDFGVVSVVDSWSGLAQETGTFVYISASRELGRIPVRVRDHKFTVNFMTKSYILEDQDDPTILYFRSPTFFYEDSPLSVSVTLTLPQRLSFVETVGSTPEPTSIDGQTIRWEVPEGNGLTLMCMLKRNSPFLVPGQDGLQFDPSKLPKLSSDEIPANADQVLRELETIIMVAEIDGKTDPDFIKLLKKQLAKLYYLYYVYGLVTDYVLPEMSEGG